MFVVAIAETAGSLEDVAGPLSTILRVAAYDVRMWLGGVLPHVVFRSASQDEALGVAAAIRARGHGAIVCDTRDVVAGSQMVQVHRFAFDQTSLWANDGQGDRLAFDDLGAVLVTASRMDVARTTTHKEPLPMRGKPRPTVVRDHTTHEHVIAHAAYLFPRRTLGSPHPRPWILAERAAQYLSLGARMRMTRHENYMATLDLLRACSPRAIYDERLAVEPRTGAGLVQIHGHDSPAPLLTDATLDLSVHLLAEWLFRVRGGPFRDSS